MLTFNQVAIPTAILMALAFTAPTYAAPATANQSGSGFLTVNGTGGADEVRLVGQGSGVVKVVDVASGNVSLGLFTGISGVRVNMKGGENRLALTDVDIPDTLTINGGSAKDTVRVNGMLAVGGFLKIDLAGGNNKVNGNAANVTSIDVGLNVTVDTGGGKDNIGFKFLSANQVTIKVGGGNDKVVVGEGSNNIANRIIINAGPGNNDVTIEDTGAAVAQVFTGSGDDEVWVVNTVIADFMDVITGGGNDGVTTDVSRAANEYRINCGPGDDTLTDGGSPTVVVDCETFLPVEPLMCTEDVLQCPDGSFVGRDPLNNCNFFACPVLP